jgi:hypothetical protein
VELQAKTCLREQVWGRPREDEGCDGRLFFFLLSNSPLFHVIVPPIRTRKIIPLPTSSNDVPSRIHFGIADELTATLFYVPGTFRFSIPKLETTLPARVYRL